MKLVSILVITFFNFAQARDIYCPSVLENNIDYFGNDISLGKLIKNCFLFFF